MYFYQTKNHEIELIKDLIEQFANIKIIKNEINVVCDKCNIIHYSFIYQEYIVCYDYPRGKYISEETAEGVYCVNCAVSNGMQHFCTRQDKINNLN